MNRFLSLRRIRPILVVGFACLAITACASAKPDTLASDPGRKAEPSCAPLEAYLPTHGPTVIPAEGCVNQANLAAMVADPNDLARGKPLTETDGARQALIVGAYRRNEDRPPASPASGASAASATPLTGGP